ncbi:MAG: hypothetical protein ACXQTW_04685 [Candidatus Methanospirareceae archaeon]
MKTIRVSDETWANLLRLKADLRARSLDDVIKKLLNAYGLEKEEEKAEEGEIKEGEEVESPPRIRQYLCENCGYLFEVEGEADKCERCGSENLQILKEYF